ncbi:MAG: glycoside hydrolase [Ruminococcaceae bacterium]|nr:glycoside hydrolase [Oscillospiraceae bacterium]
MIITDIRGVRDPFVLLENGIYYLYGTEVGMNWSDTVWACYINDSGDLAGPWKKTESLVYEKPEHGEKQFWAPEVHKYKDSYYMIASYYSSETGHRGSSILKADSPVGPFVEISEGHVTPHDRDCIDATFYLDENSQPWLVFVHEWTSTDDGIGRMNAAKLSDDLTHLVSEPMELFRADDPSWTNERITDGCFMYVTEDKELLMIWSNMLSGGKYCVGVAKSDNGKIDGNWSQCEELLFTAEKGDGLDGGHGMIFKDANGNMYLSLHSPNLPNGETKERTVFIPLNEKDGTLCCVLQ